MKIDTVDALIEALHEHDLLTPERLADVTLTLRRQFATPRGLIHHLLERHWINAFQAEQLLSADGPELSVGPYRLIDRLGEGGVCRVFKAKDSRDQSIVAIKVLRRQLMNNPEIFRRFQREIRVAKSLDHPNIVHALDAHLSERVGYLVMEYVPGRDLANLVEKNGPLPLDFACRAVQQAALGLQHAHEHRLVHRDIKPANLQVTEDGVTKILDLGLVRMMVGSSGTESGVAAVTFEGTALGTPDYMAPEQARDAKHADIRADIYSLGCSMVYLLTGQPPYPGGSVMQKLFRHQKDPPPQLHVLRPGVPPSLSALVSAMLAKKPEDRPATPADVAAGIEPYCH